MAPNMPASKVIFHPIQQRIFPAEAGFSLIEVIVALALLGLIASVLMQQASAYSKRTAIQQVARDVDAISRAGWQLRRTFGGLTASTAGGKVIDYAFINDHRHKTATNQYNHALGGSLYVEVGSGTSTSTLVVSIHSISAEECFELMKILNVQKWFIVYKGSSTLKHNPTSPYAGELTGGMTAKRNACYNSNVAQPLQLKRKLDI